MAEIVLTNVTKRWGQFYGVDNLNLIIKDNAFVTLLGPSGCGKTTTLRMIAGLETPTSGRIAINGVPVFDSELGINVPANKRSVGFLFQNYALWPNMTVYQNIAFGLSNIKEEMPEVDDEARMLGGLIKILKKPGEVTAIIKECNDKSGKPDIERAALHLIDMYEISGFAAKALTDCRLHEAADPAGAAAELSKRYSDKLERIHAKHRQAGRALNDAYEVTVNGTARKVMRKLSKEEIDLVVRRVSRIVKIGMFMDRYPSELSGGQQQRVAIARTLAPGPKVLFMDEPLSNLDAKLRLEMRSELQRLHINTGSTFVYVTHDQLEAMTLATEICLIDNGLLQQYDEPLTVYNKPSNLFVADFVGNPAINFIEAEGVQDGGGIGLTVWNGIKARFIPSAPVEIDKWRKAADESIARAQAEERNAHGGIEKSNKHIVFKPHIAKADGDDFGADEEQAHSGFIIGVRPEFISIDEGGKIDGEIFSAMPTGMETTVKIKIGNYLLTGVVFGGVLYKIGQRVRIGFRGDAVLLFDCANGRMISRGAIEFM